MKSLLVTVVTLFVAVLSVNAQSVDEKQCHFVSATDFVITGKLFDDIPNPYHRVDTVKYKGFSKAENLQVRESTGLAVVFKTDSPFIRLKATWGTLTYPVNTMGLAARGFDLYIKEDGKWIWAAAGVRPRDREEEVFTLIRGMREEMHECLLYLPLLSELNSLEIGVYDKSKIEEMPNPFRHRVAIFGSSFTQGISTSRSGMTYPAQFTRSTGIQLLSLGCSGNCKLQSYFADVLVDVDAEAFIFDSFSNPTPQEVEERLFPFIEKLQAAHPGKPLIFQHTIYRERRNFNMIEEKKENDRAHMADSLMNIACKKYKDVYYIKTNASLPSHETTVDGVHPDDYGYTLWVQSIEKKVLRILRKYGIK